MSIEECAAFPNGAHDHQVDAMTQALLRWNMFQDAQVHYSYTPYEIRSALTSRRLW